MYDKVFQLLEKMYSEMLQMKEDIYSKMHQMEEKMKQGFEEARQDRARLEHVLTDKINIVTDGVVQNSEKIDRIEDKVNSIEAVIKDKFVSNLQSPGYSGLYLLFSISNFTFSNIQYQAPNTKYLKLKKDFSIFSRNIFKKSESGIIWLQYM